MPNPIVHWEICVSDAAAGREFYGKLFGWEITADESMDYNTVNTGEEPGGGIFQAMGEMKPYVTIYAKVDDIDGTLDEAEKLGAFIIQRKKQISEEHGYYGMFADPDGNVIGLWSKT